MAARSVHPSFGPGMKAEQAPSPDELLLSNLSIHDWPRVESDEDRAVPEQSTTVFAATFDLTREQLDAGYRSLHVSPIDDASMILLNKFAHPDQAFYKVLSREQPRRMRVS